ncbi:MULTISPECIES: hypothetical protein [unclassified Nitrosospira]|uniref:hypothetical protein n=1 Tax=unclassified Nitrosospira TaxID=2609267 RepID=UPI000D307CDD|nr:MULTISPECIES: hypothetical protein [unclassified Nitrosospira]PTR16277.1 hypothetical protein C8R31_102291 [Nitrosospira sp. Nsp2]WON73722.1 hypothetical protein R5L00_14765 [Nitrosospira sp. Is2]
MPTSKPRITVTLTEEQHAILRKISAASGQSMSGVISEFMLMAQPALERMAVSFQQLKQDLDADRQRVADVLSELHAERARNEVSALSRASPAARAEAPEHPIRTTGAEPDAIQFCASVDFVRPDTNMANDSFGDDTEINPGYTKPKRSTSARTRDSAQSTEGTQKRGKK